MSEDRIEISVDDLNFIPCNNKILCKVDVVTGMGKKGLYTGNAEWDAEGGLCTRWGEIVKLPKGLSFRKQRDDPGLEWQTTLEAKVGDMAYWGIMEGTNCPVVLFGKEVFYLVDYGEVRLLKRGEEIIPVNGFVLLEEILEKHGGSLITPDSAIKSDKRKGTVRYVGKRNECYYPEAGHCDPYDLKAGDQVLFYKSLLTKLEDERYFSVAKNLWYCQSRWVVAKTN